MAALQAGRADGGTKKTSLKRVSAVGGRAAMLERGLQKQQSSKDEQVPDGNATVWIVRSKALCVRGIKWSMLFHLMRVTRRQR